MDKSVCVDIKSVLQPIKKSLKESAYVNANNKSLKTGFFDIDRCLKGIQPSDLIVIAGARAIGKTSLAINIARNISIYNGLSVAFFTLEMTKDNFVYKLLSSLTGIYQTRLVNNKTTCHENARIATIIDKISSTLLYINDKFMLSASDLKENIIKLKQEKNIDIVIIDNFHMLLSTEEDENVTFAVKMIAKDLNIPIIICNPIHENKKRIRKKNYRPKLDDLKKYGSILQDADKILFVHREEVYNEKLQYIKGDSEIIVAKNNNGPTGSIFLKFNRYTGSFKSPY